MMRGNDNWEMPGVGNCTSSIMLLPVEKQPFRSDPAINCSNAVEGIQVAFAYAHEEKQLPNYFTALWNPLQYPYACGEWPSGCLGWRDAQWKPTVPSNIGCLVAVGPGKHKHWTQREIVSQMLLCSNARHSRLERNQMSQVYCRKHTLGSLLVCKVIESLSLSPLHLVEETLSGSFNHRFCGYRIMGLQYQKDCKPLYQCSDFRYLVVIFMDGWWHTQMCYRMIILMAINKQTLLKTHFDEPMRVECAALAYQRHIILPVSTPL